MRPAPEANPWLPAALDKINQGLPKPMPEGENAWEHLKDRMSQSDARSPVGALLAAHEAVGDIQSEQDPYGISAAIMPGIFERPPPKRMSDRILELYNKSGREVPHPDEFGYPSKVEEAHIMDMMSRSGGEAPKEVKEILENARKNFERIHEEHYRPFTQAMERNEDLRDRLFKTHESEMMVDSHEPDGYSPKPPLSGWEKPNILRKVDDKLDAIFDKHSGKILLGSLGALGGAVGYAYKTRRPPKSNSPQK